MRKSILFLLIFLLSYLSGSGQQQSVSQTLTVFENAFKQKEAKLAASALSDNFSISIYSGAAALPLLQQIFNKYHPLDSLHLKEIKQNKAVVTCYFEDQKPFESTFYLDSNNLLSNSALFDSLYGMNRQDSSRLVAQIPFEIIHGSIAVKLKLNQSEESLSFLFDTGADGMGINQEVADRINLKVSHRKEASVVGSNVEVQISSDNVIHIDSVSIPHQNIAIFPQISKGFDGLFGGNLIRNYITKVDFDKKIITLYSLGKFNKSSRGKTIAVNFKSGIPQVPAQITIKKKKIVSGELNFDTGAGYNVIFFSPAVKRENLLEDFPTEYYSNNYSFGHSSQIVSGDIQSMQLSDYKLEHFMGSLQKYRAGDENWAQHSLGSLGMGIISKFNFTIDLLHKKIYLEPNNSFDQPFDMVLGGMFLSFDNGQNIFVKNVISGSSAARAGITSGTQIVSINHLPAQMLREPSAQTHLRNAVEDTYDVEIKRNGEITRISLPAHPDNPKE